MRLARIPPFGWWSLLPGAVKPDNVVVFYPTRYDVGEVASQVACPVAAFFAEHDVLPGATVEDAHALREKLQENEQVRTALLQQWLLTTEVNEGVGVACELEIPPEKREERMKCHPESLVVVRELCGFDVRVR